MRRVRTPTLLGNQVSVQEDGTADGTGSLPMSGLKISSTTSWKNSLETPPSSTPCSPSNSTYSCFFKSAGFSIAIISSWGAKGKGGDCGVRAQLHTHRRSKREGGRGSKYRSWLWGGLRVEGRGQDGQTASTDGKMRQERACRDDGGYFLLTEGSQHTVHTWSSWSLYVRHLGYGLGHRGP